MTPIQALEQARANMAAGGTHIATFNALLDIAMQGLVAPPLTLAQQHADELEKRLRWAVEFIEVYAREASGPATPELNKARAVLALVRPPPPPTLEEALDVLRLLTQQASIPANSSLPDNNTALLTARKLLDRVPK